MAVRRIPLSVKVPSDKVWWFSEKLVIAWNLLDFKAYRFISA